MDGACSKHGGTRNCIKMLTAEPEGLRNIGVN